MYRGTYIDSIGRKRERMGFYGLSKMIIQKKNNI